MPLPALTGFKGSSRLTVGGVSAENSYSPNPSQSIYFVDCSDCVLNVESRTAKVSVENCKNVELHVKHSPITSFCEIVNCDGLNVHLEGETNISTIMIDQSDNITIHVNNCQSQLEKIWWHKVSKVYVNRGGDLGLFLLDKIEENNKIQIFQHVCKVQPDNSFSKEPVIRENGYPTTCDEKVKNDDYERRAGQKMLQMLLKDVRAEEREELRLHEEQHGANPQN